MTVSGEAYCWGLGQDGRLGVGSTANLSEPARVGDDMLFFAIDAGGNHTCALAIDGPAYCWGAGNLGQLGTGGVDGSYVPVPVAGGLLFEDISAGDGYTCGVAGGGSTYCWGRNEVGQLGDGTLEDRFEPVLVGDGRAFQTVSTSLGSFGSATCGMGTDGIVYCWGEGSGGQTGTGESIVITSPARVYGQEG
jgi:alpha-tubulin suppressor-like RCC1 family protein